MTPLLTLLALVPVLQGFPPLPGKPVEPQLPVVPHALVAERPLEYVGRELRVALQFHSLEEDWNPFVTRFSPRNYLAVRGWADEQLPWVESEFERLPVRVFVPRGTSLEGFFRIGQRHERILVTGIVREVFAGQPWMEVLAAEATQEAIPEGSVLHVVRALEFESQKAYGLALGELDRALAAPLPLHAYDALLEIKKRCLEARDRRRSR